MLNFPTQTINSNTGDVFLTVNLSQITATTPATTPVITSTTSPVTNPSTPVNNETPSSVSDFKVVQDLDIVTLSWTPVNKLLQNNTDASYYQIESIIRNEKIWKEVTKINIDINSSTFNDLSSGVYRYFRIYTVSTQGKKSIPVYSSVVIPFSNPERPTNLNYYTFDNGFTVKGGSKTDYSGKDELDHYELEILIEGDRKWKEWPVEIKSLNNGQILR